MNVEIHVFGANKMTTVYLKPEQTMINLAKKLFGYTGKKFKVTVANTYRLENYWDGGSKKDCYLIERNGLKFHAPSQATTNPFNAVAHERFYIPEGTFVLEHNISCGKDMGITFYVRSDEMDTMSLPESTELSRDEKIVLIATRSFKSSYAGIKNYRFSEARSKTGITESEWNAAKESLITKGLLNKAGAINTEGKNAIGTEQFYNL
jgi:hypothetical protein